MQRVSIWLIAVLLCVPLTLAGEDRELARATFAGGCFWCMEPPYDRLEGVVETISGFSGGHVSNPSYEAVVAGGTGHLEVVQVVFDPAVVSYETLLYVFWRNIDPFQADGQFCDRGSMYRSAIFVHDEEQRRLAEASLEGVREKGLSERPIDTRILAFEAFYPAEDYHQAYYQKNPLRYRYYRWACGRDERLEELWGPEAGGSPG
ncbi:peptide-methionine (S)-S-oxide reductase [Thioalkalivibrio denitrificans]|uniref:Peptide methionine sulfoxide reductase MsrA n=1 Tax=Thioalkalivibrio denitrificans TaxID=108003 RepID=A0A1V3NK32_9GAMM|nr:peptide-methionine (S)-S-oxide reductase MsrA [Thioalkalivibrio denitrificans]OOG25415.1 peptide-methionine (S)-S-oxide reductase [Thioalkalivibrio denitrificans]